MRNPHPIAIRSALTHSTHDEIAKTEDQGMDARRFDSWTRGIGAPTSRRTLTAIGLAAIAGGWSRPHALAARLRCKKGGQPCKKKQKGCKPRNCTNGLEAPLVIEANWTNSNTDHDTFLFVPNKQGNADPAPHIDMTCSSTKTANGSVYPFAFVSGDALGPGNEITTIKKLVDGRYEYHLQLDAQSPANDVTVRLMKKGKALQIWRNPASPQEDHWRVFSLTVQNGRARLETIDDIVDQPFPLTDVCP
jgi:hypothetical protein